MDTEKATQIISNFLNPNSFKDVNVRDGKVIVNLEVPNPHDPTIKEVMTKVESELKKDGFKSLDFYTTKAPAQQSQGHRPIGGVKDRGAIAPKTPVEGVKRIVAVNSGKGGVGKTTCSVNIAVSLANLGHKVGLLDADVTGPNVHQMLGIHQKPHITDEQKVQSLEAYGVKIISMGLLADPDQPTIWRGPMLDGVIKQFLRDVDWGELDYLVVDMPPGTSDAQLTLCQNVPLDGTVIISTPQDVALMDARKGLLMFQKMKVPILGMVENMSFYECPKCSHREEIFSHGGAEKAAKELDLDFLGAIPIELKVRTGGDEGKPITAMDTNHPVSKAFKKIAENIVEKTSKAVAAV